MFLIIPMGCIYYLFPFVVLLLSVIKPLFFGGKNFVSYIFVARAFQEI